MAPVFDGSEASFRRLAQLTGLVVYDLKTKLRPGIWGVVRVLGDAAQASDLAEGLLREGFPVALVDPLVVHDQSRRIVLVDHLELSASELVLGIRGQQMPVPLQGALTIVRGEAHVRSERQTGAISSGSAYRAVVPTAEDIQAFRESHAASNYESHQVADLHFATVNWAARLDARRTNLAALGDFAGSPAQKLDQVADLVAELARVRVDRNHRTSSLAAFATQSAPMRKAQLAGATPVPSEPRTGPSDPRFDGYSLLVAEAERATLRSAGVVPPSR